MFHLQQQGHSDRINSVTNLPQGKVIVSQSKNYFAKLQEDGNLVVNVSAHFCTPNVIWCSNTANKGQAPYHLRMQDDGNLVIYDKNGHATWSSRTDGKGHGPWHLNMQDDGNLVIYDKQRKATWASNTNRG